MQLMPNSALLTNSTLVGSARLITPELHPFRTDPGAKVRQLFEFCNLVECLVLNEYVCTLPAELPDDAGDLPLLVELRKTGVITAALSVEAARRAVDAARQLLGHIGNDRVYSSAVGNALFTNENEFFRGDRETLYGDSLDSDGYLLQLRSVEYDPSVTKALTSVRDDLRFYISRRDTDRRPQSINRYLDTLKSDLNWQVSPNTSYVVHQIRNVVYWTLAETCDLSYSPDASRVEWIQSWNGRWRVTMGETIYRVVADAFQSKVEDVRSDEEARSILLPPIASMIAERARSSRDIIGVVLELRNEFEPFRADLASLLNEQRNARSISARVKAGNRIKRLFESVSAKAAHNQAATLSTAIGYSGKLIGIVEDPLSLKAYAALAERGAEWIQAWWNARPAARLLSLQERVEQLPHYWKLAQVLTGNRFTEDDVKAFKGYEAIYRAYRTAPRSAAGSDGVAP
jgi:hypothetical protein